MTLLSFGLDVELDDSAAVASAAFKLGTALAALSGVELKAIEVTQSVGARRDGLILAVVISIATPLAAPAALDVLKAALSHTDIQFSIALQADISLKNSAAEELPVPAVKPTTKKVIKQVKKRQVKTPSCP